MNRGKQMRVLKTMACACFAFGLAACGSAPPRSAVAATAVPDASAQDAALQALVQDRITETAPDSAVVVRAENGRVALSGTVRDSEMARKAVKEALSTEGVRGVTNQLDVDQDASAEAAALVAAQ